MRLYGFSVFHEFSPGTAGSYFYSISYRFRFYSYVSSLFYLNIDALLLKVRFKNEIVMAILFQVSQMALWLPLISSMIASSLGAEVPVKPGKHRGVRQSF